MSGEDLHSIDSVEKLRAIVPEPGAGIELKLYDRMVPEAVDFIARSPFLVLSTADAEGRLDASPKGDDPGFVLVEDERTLVCSKAFLRSKLWKSDTWPERQKISFGEMFARRMESEDAALASTIDSMSEEDYQTNL